MTSIDATGLIRDRLDTIVANLQAGYRAIYGQDIDLNSESEDGQLSVIFSEALSDTAQILEQVLAARSPAGAMGAALSRLVLLNGIQRNEASYSTANVTYTGTPGTVIPAGSLVDSTATPPAHFQTVNAVTIGLNGTALGTVRATTTGPVFGDSGTISVIKTPIAGWTAITNSAGVILGSNQESDAALRIRRALSTAIASQSLVDGLYAAVANVSGVSEARVFENRTGSPIARSGGADLPPNSIQVIVQGGADADIARAIWLHASAGVTMVGGTSASVVDSQGIAQAIPFDRPGSSLIFADVLVRVSLAAQSLLTTDLVDKVTSGLADFGNADAGIGKPVIYGSLFAPVTKILSDAFKGDATVISVYRIFLGHTFPPIINTDIAIPFNARASWDKSRIRVLYVVSDPL